MFVYKNIYSIYIYDYICMYYFLLQYQNTVQKLACSTQKDISLATILSSKWSYERCEFHPICIISTSNIKHNKSLKHPSAPVAPHPPSLQPGFVHR